MVKYLIMLTRGYDFGKYASFMRVRQKPKLHRDWIDPDAIKILKTLQDQGFTTYLVGGCVRDLLVGIHPKDFDIATDATPQDVKKSVPNSYIIGRRFRLVLVKRGNVQYEVSTFRRDFSADEFPEGEAPSGDNVFGTPEQDAKRRDFTLNALFYDPVKNELIDFVSGQSDVKNRILKMIGEPNTRLQEDPIRILRALRLAHKVGFRIDHDLRKAMQANAPTVTDSVLPRRREEMLKILRLDDPALVFFEAHDLGILEHTWPTLNEIYIKPHKAEDFASYLSRLHLLDQPLSEPDQLFGVLMLAYYRTMIQEDPSLAVQTTAILEHPKMQPMMKQELGMFNYEIRRIATAIHLQSVLMKREEFERKGERRQVALLKNESFPLALLMSRLDHSLPPKDLLSWEKAYKKQFSGAAKSKPETTRRRKKRRRRPRK